MHDRHCLLHDQLDGDDDDNEIQRIDNVRDAFEKIQLLKIGRRQKSKKWHAGESKQAGD